MADSGATPEFDPKHRILGAVILVTLAVILLPMILREEPPPRGKPPAREITLPAPEAAAPPVATMPATGTAPPAGIVPPPPEPDPAPAAPPRVPAAAPKVAGPPPVNAKKEPAKAPPATETSAPKPAAIRKGWVIQVGAFSRATNAEQLRDRLRKQGYGAEIEHITVDQGSLVRVLVGPYGDKAEARGALERLQNEQQLKGVLIAWPTRAAERKP